METLNPHQNFAGRWIVADSGCWEWQGAFGRGGYGQFYDGVTTRKAHRYALQLSTGVQPHRWLFACHTCDNRSCVNPQHLFWGTPAENAADMVQKGRSAHPQRRKLSDTDRAWIIARRNSGETFRSIAADFDVSAVTAHRVFHQGVA